MKQIINKLLSILKLTNIITVIKTTIFKLQSGILVDIRKIDDIWPLSVNSRMGKGIIKKYLLIWDRKYKRELRHIFTDHFSTASYNLFMHLFERMINL